MLEFFYLLFIFPLEQFLGLFLRGIFSATKNGALSVVLLSLFINLFLLKLLKCSDKKAAIQSARQAKFDERINRWKTVYSKTKVFAFTQTLYRQNHYHPIFALSSLGGLAIQIPFFLAVYFLIQNGNALPNADFASFSAINSSLGIHILPILMTAITLLNVFLSSKETAARIQGSIIAVLFLILLYKMPHALVLYWTTNMVFSLCRTLFKTKNKINKIYFLKTQKTAARDFSFYLKHAHRILISLIFIGAFAFVFALMQERETAQYENITKTVSFYLIFLGFVGFFYFLFLIRQKIIKNSFADFKNIILLSVFNIAFLICVFVPFELYNSDISQFHPSFTFKTLFGLIGAFLFVSFLMLYFISFFNKKWFIAFLLSVILSLGILNIFWLTGIYGVMDRFVFQTPVYSTPELFLWQNASNTVALFLAAAFVYFLFFKIKIIFKITLCTFVFVSTFQAYQIFQMRFEEESKYENNAHYENELFSYAKNHKNIVVIVLDMFTGSHFPYLLQFFPELKTQLDGFVWFDNAVSSANATVYTLPSIIAGEYYTIINQNKRRQNRDEATQNAYFNTLNAFLEADYQVSLLSKETLSATPHSSNFFWLNDHRALQHYFLQNNTHASFKDTHIFDISHLLSFGVFKFASDGHIRHAIYNGGKWFFATPPMDNSKVIDNIASFYAFSRIQNANANRATFKFIHSEITHFPFGINAQGGKCNYLMPGTIFPKPPWKKTYAVFAEQNKDRSLNAQHFDSEACSLFLLNNFLTWLKTENIYDNTQILIVSDHPGSDSAFKVPPLPFGIFGQDILFLFKDFGARGKLQTDSRLMANFDAATIFCENLNNSCPNVLPNILKNYPKNRAILHARPRDTSKNPDSLWNIYHAYRIQGNLYDKNAYTDVSREYATAGEFAKK